MITVYDVKPNEFIRALAQRLKEMGIERPEFVQYVKSGSHVERAPEDPDFWYVRCASILRQAYVHGRISVGGLRVHYGGRVQHNVHSEHHRDAGGKIIRKAMQVLEEKGLLKKEKEGRVLTKEGRKLLDSVAASFRG